MKNRLLRIILGTIMLATGLILFEAFDVDIFLLEVVLYSASYLVCGFDVVFNAIRNIFRGKIFDENFLMTLATVGAFAISEFPEAVAVMLFYQIGELFQGFAVGKSRKSIAELMNIRPEFANVKQGDQIVEKSPEDVKVGDLLVVAAGEKIPLDGKVVEGNSLVDTSALTGESVPRDVTPGSTVFGGFVNLNGVLTIEVEKEFSESAVSKILELVENASGRKSVSEKFITKFARYYTPIVVIVAVLLAAIPPILFKNQIFSDWLYRALTFLVVSCPCALVVSIPMSFFGGIGGASKIGVLIKGGNYLEALAKTDVVVFDKTGTLTKGVFEVQEMHAVEMTDQQLLEYAAYAESFSNHPISLSLQKAYGKKIDKNLVSEVKEVAGKGITANVSGKAVAAGNVALMESLGVEYVADNQVGAIVHVAVDKKYCGWILIADQLKPDSKAAVESLKKNGIKQVVMLTGDRKSVGESVAKEIGIDKVFCELLPKDKVDRLEEIFASKVSNGKVAFVGDGTNDAPVLARADIGVAMGGLGSDAAIEAADIVIMTDEPTKLATAKRIAKKTVGIATQNTFFAIAVKVAVLVLSAVGFANMWMAIFADVGVTVLAVMNALRALKKSK